jgi:trk system potassium uptake protein TrkA
MRQFAVIGLGRFGESLVRTLVSMGCQVLAVDSREDKVEEIAAVATRAVQADATDEAALRELGLRNFDVVVVAIGEDMQASILITVLLKELGVKYVMAKAINEIHGKVLEKVGADKVIFPERDMGIRLAHHMAAKNVLDYIELSPEYGIEEIIATSKLANKTLGQLDLRARLGVSVIALKRVPDQVVIAPGANDTVREGDVLVLVGKRSALRRLEEV